MSDRDWGAKTGGGGVASEDHEALARRERLRRLAQDTVDLAKDPYFMRNHLGSYECKLCLTLHNNEGNYLAHTQGRRHQNNMRRRAAAESRKMPERPRVSAASLAMPAPRVRVKTLRIGRPGYKITKQREPNTGQLSLLFQIQYPEIQVGLQPRHRFMSAFEQRREKPDKRYQYLIFAADPYETVAFKIPNRPIDKGEGRFYSNWDREKLTFTLQLFFEAAKIADLVVSHKGAASAEEVFAEASRREADNVDNPFDGI
jgi:splicing factor 3A subunit 2